MAMSRFQGTGPAFQPGLALALCAGLALTACGGGGDESFGYVEYGLPVPHSPIAVLGWMVGTTPSAPSGVEGQSPPQREAQGLMDALRAAGYPVVEGRCLLTGPNAEPVADPQSFDWKASPWNVKVVLRMASGDAERLVASSGGVSWKASSASAFERLAPCEALPDAPSI